MNIYVLWVILSNDTRITHISNFRQHFREIVILSNFYKMHDEKCRFLLFSTERIKRSIWNQHILVNVRVA